jgi:hypothetical protein
MEEEKKFTFIASFDIGYKNFSFYVERINIETLKNIKNIQEKDRYNIDGTCTDSMNEVLEQVYTCGKPILHKNIDLTENCNHTKKSLDPQVFFNMNQKLSEYKKYWDVCEYIVIEQQVSFGKKLNLKAIKLGQHCASYFIFNYLVNSKKIIEFPSYHKGTVLGINKEPGKKKYKNGNVRYITMSKPKRKKWSIQKCFEILSLKKDEKFFNKLNDRKENKEKLDDYSDTVTQLQAFKYLTFVNSG